MAVLLLFFSTDRKIAILALISFLLARFVFTQAIYFFYTKTRPYQRLEFSAPTSKFLLSWNYRKSHSFPSSHASSLMAISVVIGFYLPILGSIAVVLTILNGMGRVVLGYHHTNDVVVGWLVGALSGVLVIFYLSALIK